MACFKGEHDITTPYCNNICDCVDWSNIGVLTNHLRYNLIRGKGDVLTYDTIETFDSRPVVLCSLYKCKICGKQICNGQSLDNIHSFDDFMRALFSGVTYFGKDRVEKAQAVVQLLHEEDRELALDWIYDTHIQSKN